MQRKYGALRRRGQLALAALALMCCGFGYTSHAALAATVHLLILGDSLTAGYGLPPSQGFQAKLAAALKAKGQDVALIDGAVSGDTSADAAARLDWVLGGGPVDAALVELGGNDGLRGLDPELLRHNLTHILDVLAAKHIPVLLSGIIAPPSLGTAYGDQFKAVFTALSHRPGLIYDSVLPARPRQQYRHTRTRRRPGRRHPPQRRRRGLRGHPHHAAGAAPGCRG